MNAVNEKLWLVEWVAIRSGYRVCKFVDPGYAIAYEDYWSDAVKDIRHNYDSAVKVILVRKMDGTIDCWCDSDSVRRCG